MMAEKTTFICNEILCYVQNNFASSSAAALQTTISGFYTTEEITTAKSKLYEVVKRVYTSRDNLTGVRGKKLKKLINIPSFSNTNPSDDLHIDDLPRLHH